MGAKRLIKVLFWSLVVLMVGNITWSYIFPEKPIKTLHLPLEGEVQNLDPANACTLYEHQLIGNIYEALLEYDYLSRPFKLIPNLAEEMPTVSIDGLNYTFKIKQGVYFHDNICFPSGKGREITAEDFVYTFKRSADPTVVNGFLSNEHSTLIKGYMAFHKHLIACKGDYNQSIEGIEAIDKYTLKFTLTKPCPSFLYDLASVVHGLVSKEAVAYYGENFIHNPVGTGPFTLEQFNPQSSTIILTRNKNFREKLFPKEAAPHLQHMLAAAGQKLPFIDSIAYHVLPEAEPRWLEFTSKDKRLDCLQVHPTYITKIFENQSIKKELQEKSITLLTAEDVAIRQIGFNTVQAPLDNLKVRQAISLAFDWEGYKQAFTDNFAADPCTFIPKSFLGYDETVVNSYAIYDLAKAEKCLIEAGYPNGKGLPTLLLCCAQETSSMHQATFFVKCMKRIGIQIEVEYLPIRAFLEKLSRRDFMLTQLGTLASCPDAKTFLHALRTEGQPCSTMRMSDPIFDKRYEQAVTLSDSPEKAALYQELNKIAIAHIPALLLPSIPNYTLVHARVKNYFPNPYSACIQQYIDLDLSEPASE